MRVENREGSARPLLDLAPVLDLAPGESRTIICPVHDDSSPSCWVLRREDGSWYADCRAGCDWQRVRDALGLPATGRSSGSTSGGAAGRHPEPGAFWRREGSKLYAALAHQEEDERRAIRSGFRRMLALKGDRRRLLAEALCQEFGGLDGAVGAWHAAVKQSRSERKHHEQQTKPDRRHIYRDEDGRPLFASVRQGGRWRLLRAEVEGQELHYLPGMAGVRRVLYRLPEVLAAKQRGEEIWVVEGEKDADELWRRGYPATCNPMGAGKWKPEYAETLRGARVLVVPDYDLPGYHHAERVIRSLRGVAAAVRYLELPGLPVGGDVSDWLEMKDAA